MRPLTALPVGPVADRRTAPSARLNHRGATITALVVEDSPVEAMRLHQLLSRAPGLSVRVAMAGSATQALRRLEETPVDVILASIDLAGQDAGLVHRLALAAPARPIVVLCSARTEELALEALRQGAQDYVVRTQATADGLVRTIRCAMERHGQVAALRSQSLTDELTGLLNRRGFQTLAGTQVRLGNRTGSRFLLLFADLDGLKGINDSLGHHMGDQALRAAAAVFQATFRQSDVLARLGGDEFAVLALDQAGDGGRAVLSRLDANLERANATLAGRVRLGLSLGGVSFTADPEPDLSELLASADRAMYDAKLAGRPRPD
jgi:diguanylate cyclase (GGDEF)-like protein